MASETYTLQQFIADLSGGAPGARATVEGAKRLNC
jgi:hypothetical protein